MAETSCERCLSGMLRSCCLVLLASLSLTSCGALGADPIAAPAAYAQPAPTIRPVRQRTPTPAPASATPLPIPVASATPSASPLPTVNPTATPLPLLGGAPAPRLAGEMAMRTYSLDFYRLPGGLEGDAIRAFALKVEDAVIYDSQRIGGQLAGRVAISFEPPQSGACAIRGITFSHERRIHLFYAPGTDPQRVVNILAHELFHQLQHDYYGQRDHLKSDVILLEGMATWGTSGYFLAEDGRPLYHHRAKEALADGSILPLTTSLEADCRTTTRVNIYNEWASFVEYLITMYGRAKFDEVYRNSSGRPAGSASYKAVYGKSLAQLEPEWLEWLKNTP